MIYGLAKAIDFILDKLIRFVEGVVSFVKGIFKGLMALLAMGGCLFFLLFAHFGLMLLTNPLSLTIMLTLILLPILGARFAKYLKYVKYITTEYLYNTSNYYIDKRNHKYLRFNNYKVAYKRAENERKRKEQERYYQQQQEWFKQWHQQNFHGNQGGYGGHGYSGQGSYGHGFANPMAEFKNKYEKSCQVLGVSNKADKNQIKVAYRKLAKEYHPDVNKHPDATKKFQVISDAYNFLSDDNIQRYASIG